ncbi:hypothetical protein [Polaromonas sp.]|uniref:hypothetical protein n=1 Tax=Polaromonas sp. TaxID=1869339 RepID=UPI003263B822
MQQVYKLAALRKKERDSVLQIEGFPPAAAHVSGYFVTHLALAVETFQNSLRTINSF